MVNKIHFSSKSDEHATPQPLFDQLNRVYQFDLDVAATPENTKCAKYFTKDVDGLVQKWYGNVWMNPPYSKLKNWIEKAFISVHEEECDYVVGLLPARTDTIAFHEYIYPYAHISSPMARILMDSKYNRDYADMIVRIHFIKGRLKFGDAKDSAPFPSMLVEWSHV